MEFYKNLSPRNKHKYVTIDGEDICLYDANMKRMKSQTYMSSYIRKRLFETCTLITDEDELAKLMLLLV